jgi:hypothetical protein
MCWTCNTHGRDENCVQNSILKISKEDTAKYVGLCMAGRIILKCIGFI